MSGGFGDGSVPAPLSRVQHGDLGEVPDVGDRYEARGVVGVGGVGQVEVVRDRWLDRDVARKTLTRGDVAEVRLAREARITARLDHPGVVPVYDTGDLEDGRRYYTMRLVRGRTLADASAGAPLTERVGRVRALLAVAEAVAYAHSVGVVHRDLKPHNMLVGAFGEVLVADWGLARTRDEPGAPEGTPGYSSPEQLAGGAPDPRDDVYALGRSLWFLLLGESPPLQPIAPADAPADLVAVARRACLGPAERYPDAVAFAQDLAAFVDGRRVSAHEYGAGELAGRFWRAFRLPIVVGAVGVAGVALAAGVALVWTDRERDRAVAAELDSRRALGATLAARAVDAHGDGATAEAEVLAAHALARADRPDARGVFAAFPDDALPTATRVVPLPGCATPRRLDAATACVTEGGVEVRGDDGSVTRLAVEGDVLDVVQVGDAIAVAARTPGGVVAPHLRLFRSGAPVAELPFAYGLSRTGPFAVVGHEMVGARFDANGVVLDTFIPCEGEERAVFRPTVSPEGRASGACTRSVWFREGDRAARWATDAPPSAVVWAGDVALIGTWDARIVALDLDTGAERAARAVPGGNPHQLAARGRDVWVSAERGGPSWYDAETSQFGPRLPATRTLDVAWTGPDVAAVGVDLAIYRPPAARRPHVVALGHGVTTLDVGPDGAVVAGGGRWISRIDAEGYVAATPIDGDVKDVVVGPDATFVGTAGGSGIFVVQGGEARLWPLPDAPPVGRRLVARADGTLWATTYAHVVGVFTPNAEFGEVRRDLGPYADAERAASADAVVLLDEYGGVDVIDPGADAPVRRFTRSDARAVALAPDGGDVVVASRDTLTRHDAHGARIVEVALPDEPVDVAWSPDGACVAVGLLDGRATVYRAGDLSVVAVLTGHRERVAAVVFGPGDLLVTGSWDRTIRRWNLERALDPPGVDAVEARWALTLAELDR